MLPSGAESATELAIADGAGQQVRTGAAPMLPVDACSELDTQNIHVSKKYTV